MSAIEPSVLISAYSSGIFPMGMENGRLSWFSPDPRGILPIADFHVPRSTRAELLRSGFEIRVNTMFNNVVLACSGRQQTWITKEIITSYERLHKMGYAHSVETWRDDKLLGGLYGVSIGGAFFGESMFSNAPSASKAALVWLMEHLKNRSFILHDTQWTTPHLAMFGGYEIPRDDYIRTLEGAVLLPVNFTG
ncbi:MAG: leucyl/phenylalanyl-tRNA--protein transferase [Verrucomicrobia bacterium]|nr:leucyl/phenylalanyl-tRNA--protein transferase [Verrucomicrobiota bacterium]